MKKSMYVVELSDKNKFYLFNCKNSSIIELNRLEEKKYKNLPNYISDKIIEENRFLKELYKNKIIINDDFDELKAIEIGVELCRDGRNTLSLSIMPTNTCNMKCPYCFQSKAKPKFMKDETYRDILKLIEKKIRHEHIYLIHITWYGGEPLLQKSEIINFSKTLKIICSKNKIGNDFFITTIITNGYFLEVDFINELKKYTKISSIQVTIDGWEKEHDERRPLKNGKSSFYRIIENVKNVSEISPIYIRHNIDKRNKDKVFEFLDKLNSAINLQKENINFHLGHTLKLTQFCNIENTKYMNNEEFINLEIALDRYAEKRGYKYSSYPKCNFTFCSSIVYNNYVIDTEGILFTCWDSIEDKRNIIGNVKDGITNDVEYFKWLSFNPARIKECKKCKFLPICMGGCPYIRMGRSPTKPECAYNEETILKIIKRTIGRYYHEKELL